MKKLLLLFFILINATAFTQDSLKSFNYSRNNITLNGMRVLGIWGGTNLSSGIAIWTTSHNNINKHFGEMQTFWGAINLGAAILGTISAKKNLNKQLSAAELLKAQQKIEKTFLINGLLDVGYTGAGLALRTSGNNRNDAMLKGFGSSIAFQGIFLLIFDSTMYEIQKHNGKKYSRFIQSNL